MAKEDLEHEDLDALEEDEDLDTLDEDEEEDEDLDQDEDEDKDDEDDDDDEDKDDEDGNKPATKAEVRKLNKRLDAMAAERRKNGKRFQSKKPYKPDDKKGDKDKKPWEAPIKELQMSEMKRTFGHQYGLSPKEVDLVFRYDPKPTKATLKDPFVQGGLERLRAQSDVRKNLPRRASAQNVKVNGKEWKDMDAKERQAAFIDRRKAIVDAKRNR